MNVGILGVGEVGSAIKRLTERKHKVLVKDLDRDKISGKKIDLLHVCIPYTKKFAEIVEENIKQIKPKLVIIESTVAVGTTRKIYKKTKIPIAHSPIRGMHPNLFNGIKTFIKYIGPIDKKAGKTVKSYYQNLGIKAELASSPEETELAKLLDTTYYAWNIVFCKEVKKICDRFGLDFNMVYTEFNRTYNQGYHKLGKTEVVRPILKPIPGGFGGHCLYENASILADQLDKASRSITEIILKVGKKNNERRR